MIAKEENDLKGFFTRLEELKRIIEEGAAPKEGIILSTIHSSKGLEYDEVYIVDVIDEILPATGDKYYLKLTGQDKKDYEEERRLFYVAMTRAKRKLHILNYYDYGCSFTDEIFGRREPKRKKNKSKNSVQSKQGDNTAIKKKNNDTVLQTFKTGDRIEHNIFGKGKVVDVRENQYIDVIFDKNVGKKTFLSSYLRKL